MVQPVLAALERKAVCLPGPPQRSAKRMRRLLWHVTLPSISGALMAGLALGVGRGMGEVGMGLLTRRQSDRQDRYLIAGYL